MSSDAPAGRELAGYRIERLLSRGGMGSVYLAEDLALGRRVALKLLLAELAQDERFRKRFLRESRVAASLDHPNIVPIYQAGEEEGVLFIAMRYVEGEDLRALLVREGPLPSQRALDTLGQVASALDAAHARGLVHRDLKPANVLLDRSGHAYLADFGLSKRASSVHGLTGTGQLLGTIDYVAPEQVKGEPLDHRADIYALACVLYQCLTGQAPFPRESDVAALWAHVHQPPPAPSSVRPDLPARLDSVLRDALAKDPSERPGSAGSLIAAAAAAFTSQQTPLPSGAATDRRQQGGARTFVGRARELDELRAALVGAQAGHGSLILISGEPGIGKSRLIATIADDAEAQGWLVAVGRCWEGGGAPAYWPWIQAVREAGGEFAQIAGFAESGASTAARPASERVSGPIDADAARFQLFDRVGRYLIEAARERPFLVVLEDLHAADEPSLLLLRFVAASAERHPLVILGSYREGEGRVRELADLFASLARLGRRMPLRGLSSEEVARYVALVSGNVTSLVLAARIGEVTGGNPFFISEIVRELAAEGRLERGAEPGVLPLPEEVRALIRRRLATLSPAAMGLLRVAAAIGREFDLRVIAAATALGGDEMVAPLNEGVRTGVVVEPRGRVGTYAFAHELVRETLYEDIPAGERMALHRTLGQALERLYREDIEPHLAEIAHHLALAAPLGETERAVEYSVRAADRSRDVFAYEEAVALYERALQLLGRAPAPPERTAEIHLKLGDALARAGSVERARDRFEDAAAVARRVGATHLFARAALGHGAAYLFGHPPTVRAQTVATGVALLEEALASLPAEDSPLRARALAMLAGELYWLASDPAAANTSEHRDRHRRVSRDALEMAKRLGDPDVLVEALYGRYWATLAPDSPRERLDVAEQMLAAATAARSDDYAFLARQARAHCFLELCDVVSVDAEIEAMDRLARRTERPLHAWYVATLRAMRTLLEGRVVDAEHDMRDAFEESGLGDKLYVRYMFEHAQLLAVRWAQGRLEEIADRIREHGLRIQGIAPWRDALAAAELGDARAARAELERFAHDDFSTMPQTGLWILHASVLAEACVLVRDAPRASILYALLRPYADRNAISLTTLPFGPVATRLAMLAALLGRWTDAEEHFERALGLCNAMGARAIRARVLVEKARMLQARGSRHDLPRADEALSEATALCEELGLTGIAARAAALSGNPRS